VDVTVRRRRVRTPESTATAKSTLLNSVANYRTYEWHDVPTGDLFYLIVGTDSTGVYESSWGEGESGEERNPDSSSWMCGVTSKDSTLSCP